jgi:hypothetical protein
MSVHASVHANTRAFRRVEEAQESHLFQPLDDQLSTLSLVDDRQKPLD